MKRRNRQFEIFSLSFLDLISCGFGAVVLLVLISRTSEDVATASIEDARNILSQMTATERSIAGLNSSVTEQNDSIEKKFAELAALKTKTSILRDKLNNAVKADDAAKDDLEGLELVDDALKKANIRPATTNAVRDEEVGGIPVDSDYVLFIVDTSGSMQAIWPRVSNEMQNVLAIHPKVKGFQIMNDNGIHLISAYAGKWIPDTANRRKNIFKAFQNWGSASNSSPVEGLKVALKRYAKPSISMSIYILGDDYSGSDYDLVIDDLQKRNTNRITGKPLAKIHGIGFISHGATNRFSILLREVSKRNGGTFLALPK
ncbi:hypothetical protein A9Q83_16550 [Alphaproteobacteria bacterium 46_93_T64]|nr:hypothetical protein A9Q83_16550 [Alphaproteobacteria bacterium 46_93_T64]